MSQVDIENRDMLARTQAHDIAIECLAAGIEAAHPATVVPDSLSVTDGQLTVDAADGRQAVYELTAYEEVVIVGGGNAAGSVAAELEAILGDRVDGGAVVTDGPAPTDVVDVLPGNHPLPSTEGIASTQTVLERAAAAGEDDLVVAVITGGASALLAGPAEGVGLSDLRETTDELLACGASIDEINAVRKHCSAIKGGGLARAVAPATLCTLVVSDVVGDDLSVIGSGPTVSDPSSYADARSVIDRYDLEVPEAVQTHLEAGDAGKRAETPAHDDPVFDRTETYLLATGWTALEAARRVADRRGYEPLVLASRVRGEAREAALTHVAIAEECLEMETPVDPPAVLLSGGETTVTLGTDPGTGGPNQEFVTSAAVSLEVDDIVVASVDTDGIDGATDAAGALADATTIPADDGRDALEANDVFPLLEDANALIRTGPTGTNVNDLRVFVVESVDCT